MKFRTALRAPLVAATQRAGPLSSCPKTISGSSRSGLARPEGYFETCSESAFQNEIPSRVASAEGRPSPAAQAAGRWAGTGSAKRARRDTGRSIAEGERQRRRPLAAATHRAGPLSSCPKTVYGSRSGPARPEGYFETCSKSAFQNEIPRPEGYFETCSKGTRSFTFFSNLSCE